MKVRGLAIPLLFIAMLSLAACGSGGGSAPAAQAPGTVGLQGTVLGTAAPAASLTAAPVPLAGDVVVVVVDETGKQAASQVVNGGNGNFSVRVPGGHQYVMVFRQGTNQGKTMGVLAPDATGKTTISLPAGSSDVNLGNIVIDPKKGKATCLTEVSVAHPDQDLPDTDSDGVPDVCDNSDDEDGDGVLDSADDLAFDETESMDTDRDGIGNNVDTDDDGDGVADAQDVFPTNPNEVADNDHDGIGNNVDTDDDNDGVADGLDAFPLIAAASADTDGDGQPDSANATQAQVALIIAAGLIPDNDDDGDGIPNADDPEPTVPVEVAPLEFVQVPEPINLGLFLKAAADGSVNAGGFPNVDPAAKAAAVKLGKALFWDMNVGSDVQACASCHYQAGADALRSSNQAHPGANGAFDVVGPNVDVVAADFPYVQFNPVDAGIRRGGVRISNVDDVVGSQGVFFTQFQDITVGDFLDVETVIADPVFNVGGVNSRRVTGRNAPPSVNAVFNYSNFWDGRARNIFNGVNPFGELDQNSGIFVQTGGAIDPVQEIVRIPDSSLASQAVGPPGSDVEMCGAGRPFAKIGKKLLAAALKPLVRQQVHPEDSVLGGLADTPTGLKGIVAGENTYVTLIKEAFQEKWWNSPNQHITLTGGVPAIVGGAADPNNPAQFTQMEANFSLFFGLAVQIYEATLVSDDSKFDRVMKGQAQFTAAEQEGFTTFFGGGHCSRCHSGPEFTIHSISNIRGGVAAQAPGFLPANAMKIGSLNGGSAYIDNGFVNLAVRPTAEDLGWGGNSPFINPLTQQPYPLAFAKLAILKRDGLLPADVAQYVPDLPGAVAGDRVAVDGTFKVPHLRNVELTGPYFHNGSASTLTQVVEFYTRMGNFPQENIANVDPDFQEIGQLRGQALKRASLVSFLLTLTDDRVRFERAPFDHPQFFFPAGDGLEDVPGPLGFAAGEGSIELPAVGAAGRVDPLVPFLNLNPVTP